MSTLPLSTPDVPFLDGVAKNLLIGGKWRPAKSERVIPSINPSTGATIGEFAQGDTDDVDAAVKAARKAYEGPWRRFTPRDRQNVLLRLADLVENHLDELRTIDVIDMGAPLSRARASGSRVVQDLRYFAGWPTKIHGETVPNSLSNEMFTYTRKEPVGVCAGIVPWNGPLTVAVMKIAPVLATGCTLVLKPAEQASLTALRLGELIQELDLPPGVINIVTGYGETAGAALAAHHDVDKIAFTGSTAVGQSIVRAAAGNLKRVSLELGGKSPDIVFADADLDAAVPGASMGVFGNSGQVCCAGTRVFVERPIYKEFVTRMTAFAQSLKVGNSLDPETEIGPIVSQTQLDRVAGYVDVGLAEGARMTTGGRAAPDGSLAEGYFMLPTVFADVADGMRIAQEEIFGPVAAVLPFDSIEEVIQRSNSSPFGLGGGVWTRDVGKAHRVAAGVNTGVIWVNTYGLFDATMPFGGTKMSGWGNELSMHGLDEYLNVKAVWVKTD